MNELEKQKESNEKLIEKISKKLDLLELKVGLVLESINHQLNKRK